MFSVAAYFGTEPLGRELVAERAGEPKGRNPAGNGAREGAVSVAERIPRLLDEGCMKKENSFRAVRDQRDNGLSLLI